MKADVLKPEQQLAVLEIKRMELADANELKDQKLIALVKERDAL